MGPADSHRITRVPRYSGFRITSSRLRIRGSHPLWPYFPERSPYMTMSSFLSYNPGIAEIQLRFRLFPGRSPLLGESFLFSFPPGTKMFQFPGFASHQYNVITVKNGWVVPFGNPRVNGYLRLTAAYRSLSRPSSPP